MSGKGGKERPLLILGKGHVESSQSSSGEHVRKG